MKIQHFFDEATGTLTYLVHDATQAVVIDPLRDYEPKVYMNRPMTRPMSDTWVVNQFDGRMLRAHGRHDEALALQEELLAEWTAGGSASGFVHEELAEKIEGRMLN